MQIGLIGLGKMGGNMAERLRRTVTRWSATTATRPARATSTRWRRWSPR